MVMGVSLVHKLLQGQMLISLFIYPLIIMCTSPWRTLTLPKLYFHFLPSSLHSSWPFSSPLFMVSSFTFSHPQSPSLHLSVLLRRMPSSRSVTVTQDLFQYLFQDFSVTLCPGKYFCPSVEHERDLLQARPYWKEFRFDLTPLPQGETVTAAEFRIYKTLTMSQRANRTLHISVYEIQREKKHRSYSNLLYSACFSSNTSVSKRSSDLFMDGVFAVLYQILQK